MKKRLLIVLPILGTILLFTGAVLYAQDGTVPIPQGIFAPVPDEAPAPADNPMTPEKIELGKMLYFDPRLSSSGVISCHPCHNLSLGGTDRLPTSLGHEFLTGGRNAPTVLNAAFFNLQFWDGRATGLEEQAQGPIEEGIKMWLRPGTQIQSAGCQRRSLHNPILFKLNITNLRVDLLLGRDWN